MLIHWPELYPILIHWPELYPINTLLSAPNQTRVLRHPSRQPIRIEYYVTRGLSTRLEVPSRLSARFGSLLPILIHKDLHPPPPVSSAHSSTTQMLHKFIVRNCLNDRLNFMCLTERSFSRESTVWITAINGSSEKLHFVEYAELQECIISCHPCSNFDL